MGPKQSAESTKAQSHSIEAPKQDCDKKDEKETNSKSMPVTALQQTINTPPQNPLKSNFSFKATYKSAEYNYNLIQ